MNRSFACSLLLASTLTVGALAQTPVLVSDVNPGTGSPGAPGSHPRQFTTVSGKVVFTTLGEDSAYRLWATDGTAAGTEVLTIFCTAHFSCPEPLRVGEVPGLAFFRAGSGESSSGLLQLWRTDGTRAGTFPVSPPLILGDSGFPVAAATLGQRLLFSACDDSSGTRCALWSTDGTAVGTGKVMDRTAVGALVSNGRRALFSGFDTGGTGVWVTNGVPADTAGTELILRGNSGYLTASGSKLFFMAGGEDYPPDLWVSDGTKRGSQLLVKFVEPSHRFPAITTYLKPVPGGVIFVAARIGGSGVNLWRSDGTRKGTQALTAFQNSPGGNPREDQIAVLRDRIFFVSTSTAGPRLWTSRGSPATTGPVAGSPALLTRSPLSVTGSHVVFAAQDTAHGAEPWTSDGTRAGTRLLRDLCPGPCGSAPGALTSHNGVTDFQATWNGRTRFVRTNGVSTVPLATVAALPVPDPFDFFPRRMDLEDLGGRTFFAGLDPLQGEQPWMTDGTRPGTRMIAAIEGGGGSSSNPRDFLVLGNQLLFTANDGIEHALWRISPSGDLSRLAGTGEPGPSELTESGLYAYYVVDRGQDEELWRTDGTPAGTLRLASFQDKTLSNLRDVGGRILFLVSSTTGEQPVHSFWTSDGTPAGTAERFDLPTDTVRVSDVAALGPELYFLLRREGVAQIFRSDGTAAGTRSVFELSCDCIGSTDFVRFAGGVYFAATGAFGVSLYRTDGTAAGTVEVIPPPGATTPVASEPQAPFEFQGELYFFARNPDQLSSIVRVLWKIGPTGDPVLVKTVGFGPFDPVDPQFSAVLGGPLYFRAWDPEHGFELWRTDGTTAGTVLVRDIEPGPFSSDPQEIVATGGAVWFSALDRLHGRELWTSDGTTAGTRLVSDLAEGGVSSSPEELTPFAGKLFFSADNQVVGREPWSLMILNP